MAAANASSAGMTAALDTSPTSSAAVVSASAPAVMAPAPAEDEAVKAVQKRYEALMTVRCKARKGKGAWYWEHLMPIYQNSDTGVPKAVKLRCSLCEAVFSASNPSRTASEHLKRGTCPNFSSSAPPAAAAAAAVSGSPSFQTSPSSLAKPISSFAPSSHHHHHHHNRKRSSPLPALPASSYQVSPLTVMDPSTFPDVGYSSPATPLPALLHPPHHLVLSGGKEDLEALAVFEDSVKRLKSPKAPPVPALSKAQAESAISLLADWVYESCGAVSFSSLMHPKFGAFLQQVGLRAFPSRDLTGPRLDARFDEAWHTAEARIQEALFFQIASDGWKPRAYTPALPGTSGDDGMVSLTLNLPNGSSVFHKAVFINGKVPSKFAEEVFSETITSICRGMVQRCAGIVSNKFKLKALRELENRNHWMVNLPCQLQGFNSLIKDFVRDLPFFRAIIDNCSRVAQDFNKSQVGSGFHYYKYHRVDWTRHFHGLPVPLSSSVSASNLPSVLALLEDIRDYASKVLEPADDSHPVPVVEGVCDMGFWNDLDAACSLIKIIREMAQEMETERPFVGQCLPLWEDLRSKVKEWCDKYGIDEVPVNKVIEKRFKRNYHPAWSAAFVLDPLYLMKDTSGKYLPPFKFLTEEQQKDVDKLITRLVSPEEAHIALMELLKWRSVGLDRDYALAVQMKQRDPMTGKMRITNPLGSRLVWESHLREFKSLGKVAVRLIFLHATSCGFKCNLSFLRWAGTQRHSRTGMERVQKLVLIAANAKLERGDFSNEEEKDEKLFTDRDDDVSDEVLMDATSV